MHKIYSLLGYIIICQWLMSCNKQEPLAVDTRDKPVLTEEKKVFRTPSNVSASNQLDGGKLSGFGQLNDSTFKAFIRAEAYPVNNSPWYAFKLWGPSKRDIYLQISYEDGSHRYWPKISRNSNLWQPLPLSASQLLADSTLIFKLPITSEPLLIAAQEVLSTQSVYNWSDSISTHPMVEKSIVGYSHRNQKLEVLKISAGDNKPMLVVLGRQHPPEVTGHLAMVAFVEQLLDSSAVARAFRQRYEVCIFPQINPDGVSAGHWRYNAKGVDLNRDWLNFHQPETQAIRSYLTDRFKSRSAPLAFAIDFHSTQEDMFYICNSEMTTPLRQLTELWLADIQNRMPGYTPVVEVTGLNSPSAKVWFYQTFATEFVTYEVGDETPRNEIKRRASVAAQSLMEALIASSNQK